MRSEANPAGFYFSAHMFRHTYASMARAGGVPVEVVSTILATLADENRRLRQETSDLKAEHALAYGTRRQAGQANG